MPSSRVQHDVVSDRVKSRAELDPILAAVAGYLATRRSRRDIDPTDIRTDLLPHLFILAAETDAATGTTKLRIRLAGTALDNAFGRSVKGCCMEDFLHGTHSAAVLAGFHHCHAAGEAIWMRQVVRIGARVPRYVEGVAFPVDPGLIYGGLVFGEVSDRSAASSFELQALM